MKPEEISLYSLRPPRHEDVRQFLHEEIDFDVNGTSKRATRLDALIETTGMYSVRGDGAAEADLIRLQDTLQPPSFDGRVVTRPCATTRSQDEFAKRRASTAFPICMMYLKLIPEIEEVFCKKYGEKVRGQNLKPFMLMKYYDETMRKAEAAIKAERRKEVRGKGYDVGRNKPPLHTRFQPGHKGNPTGRAKKQPSVLDSVTKALSDKVSVRKADGTIVQVSHVNAAYRPIFKKAIDGNARARRELFDLILAINKEGLLSPDLIELRKLYEAPQKNRLLCLVKEAHYVEKFKEELVALYTNQYGPVDDFVTDYERSLPEHPLKIVAREFIEQIQANREATKRGEEPPYKFDRPKSAGRRASNQHGSGHEQGRYPG